jgi:glucose 1-dehydrogenase
MEAIAIVSGTKEVRRVGRPEPSVQADDEVKLKVRRVGICGTDREEVAGGRAKPPAGEKDLVIGHEMFGQVVDAGAGVTRVKPGDYAVFTVRRGCGKCLPCRMNRSDMCLTGEYTERGIWGQDGYQTEFVVDKEDYIVRAPPELEPVGVLAEPLSVAEKAIHEAVRVQMARRPDALVTPDWLIGRRCLVAGLGPIGLLAALILRLRGADVYGLDIVDEGSPRPQWLRAIGGRYVDGRKVQADRVDDQLGPMEFIFEATGIAKLEFTLLDALGEGGAYVLTGIPGGDRPAQLHAATLMRDFVLDNKVMLGSVNAARGHFQMAVDDLEQAQLKWGDHLAKLITDHVPHDRFQQAFGQHSDDEIKVTLEW